MGRARRSRRNSGTISTHRCRRARICVSTRILQWTEVDIWAYTQRENIPIIPLYLAKDGKRYRSLGDQDITSPVASNASTIAEILVELDGTKVPERAGRAMDHESEDAFERLRTAGYL